MLISQMKGTEGVGREGRKEGRRGKVRERQTDGDHWKGRRVKRFHAKAKG